MHDVRLETIASLELSVIGIDRAVVRSFQSALELVGDATSEDALIAEFVNKPVIIESFKMK